MKKILILIFVLILAVFSCLLVACDDGTESSSSRSEQESQIESEFQTESESQSESDSSVESESQSESKTESSSEESAFDSEKESESQTETETQKPENTVTVKFDAQGGTPIDDAVTEKGEKVSKPSDPEKFGYIFDGWYVDGEKWSFVGYVVTEDMTLTAKWTPIEYTITFVGATASDIKYTIEDSIILFEGLTKTGYEFNGWFEDETLTKSISKIEKGNHGDKTIYAKWTPIEYTITFVGNVTTTPIKYTIEDTVTFSAGPAKTGYEFDGWFEDEEFTKPISKIDKGSIEDKTVYAKTTPIEYTITFVGNVTNSPIIYTIEDTVTFSAGLAKTGYEFDGWFEDEKFTKPISKINKGSIGDKTVYAKTTPIEYTITFVGATTSSIKYTVEDTVTLPVLTKTGYEFNGWFEDDKFTTPISKIDKGSVGDKTAYAKWTIIEYTISFVGATTSSIKYTVEDTVTLPAGLTKKGYEFNGWFEDEEFTKPISKIDEGSVGNKTVYAKWTIIEYTITFVGATTSSIKYTVEDTVTLPVGLTKTGYEFNGWFENETLTKSISKIDKGSVGDKTVYAKWTPIEYTITFVGNVTNSPIIYTIEDTVTFSAGLAKTGYEFNGWFEDDKFTKPISKIDKGSIGNKTVYAKTNPIEYTITFVGNVTNSPIIYTIEDTVTFSAGSAKTGYEFDGWFEDEEFTKPISKINKGSVGDKTVYAKTNPIEYTITFVGATASSIKYTVEDTVTLPVGLTKTGYEFNGWFEDEEFTKPISKIDEGSVGDKTVYAKTTPIQYTITFVGNVTNSSIKYTVEDSFDLPVGNAKNYYEFAGWFEDEALTKSISKIENGSYGNKTIYAKTIYHPLTFTLVEDTYRVSDCDNEAIKIVIPSTYNDKSVTSIGAQAFYGCKSLTSVTIPDSVTSIGSSAFYGCKSLTSVTIPDSVTSIGSSAFYGCTALASVTIGDSVTSIDFYAFRGCTSLTSITIPDSVTSISTSAFEGCTALTSIEVDENNTAYKSINGNLYSKDGKTLIQYAIGKKDASFVIPDSVTSIGIDAFAGCAALTSVTIGDSVTSINTSAFEGCTSLTSIEVDENNTKYKSIDGNLYSKDGKTLIRYAIGKKDASFEIPDSVTKIGDRAFYRCTSLTSITIGDRVTSIGNSAFSGCTKLESVTIPNSVTSIGNGAFDGCTSLTSVTIPNSVTSIGIDAFRGCTALTSVTIPNSVTSIGNGAFDGCTSLTSVTIPNSVTVIGGNVFHNCTSLTSVTIPNSVTSIGNSAFFGCKSLTSVTIPNSVTVIGRDVFSGCTALTSVTIPNSVTVIDKNVFYNCTSLTSVTIPDSVTSIGDRAFYGCTKLESITIPDSVTSIGYRAFDGCTALKEINCEAESQPDGWDNNWKNSCNATVVWGYKGE